MKKRLLLLLCVVSTTVIFAQKNEIKALEKAVKKSDFTTAKSALSAAESLLGNMDDKLKAKFYALKTKILLSTGSKDDVDGAIESLEMLKSIAPNSKYIAEINTMASTVKNSFINTASESYDKKDFASAAKGFEQVYKMSPQDTIYLYYAASAAVSGKDYETSLKHYETLKNIGYTGVTDQYFATDIESGEEQLFNDKATRDLYVKGKSHNNPRDVKTESKKGEIVKNVALIYIQQGDNDKALEAMADARKADPTDLGLILSEANIYLELGERDKFKALMEEAVEQDPNNPELQYNLGVVTAQAGDNEGAIKYYEKAISLDPKHANSYNNIAAVILGEETEIVDKMNSLGNSAADNRKYEEYKAQRTELYNSAIPYLQKALEVAPNIDTARTLMNIYSVIGETDKFKEMKAKVESMN